MARARRVRHLVYASSAVVYGRPVRVPIGEDHPLRVLEARKPAYAVAKEAAEKLALLAASMSFRWRPPISSPNTHQKRRILADAWHLDDARFRETFAWAPRRGPAQVRELLKRAMGRTWDGLAAGRAGASPS